MTPGGRGAASADQMSTLSRCVSCLAIILSSCRFVVRPVRARTRLARSARCTSWRVRPQGRCGHARSTIRAGRRRRDARASTVDLLVHPVEELHGGLRPALAERIERLDRHAHHRCVRHHAAPSYQGQSFPLRLPFRHFRTLWAFGSNRGSTRGWPCLAHRRSDTRPGFRLLRTALRRPVAVVLTLFSASSPLPVSCFFACAFAAFPFVLRSPVTPVLFLTFATCYS